MEDGIIAIAVPQAATAYVRPSALVFTAEGGVLVLHVTRGREDTLRLLAEKRVRTRDERYRLAIEVAEGSVLPERSDAPTVTVAATPSLHVLMEAAFEVMPLLDRLEQVVYDETPGLDAFVLPYAPEVESGFGVIRTHAGPLLETFHSRRQAAQFLKRHKALIADADWDEACDGFGRSPIVDDAARSPEAFGGFAAAVIGARYRVRRMIRRTALRRR